LNALIKDRLLRFLEEDLFMGDALKVPDIQAKAEIISKDEGIVAGIEVLKVLFDMADVEVVDSVEDGAKIGHGDIVMVLKGSAREILAVERTALNILMRMSGIATAVAKMVEKARRVNPKIIIAGTRKTTPGFRLFEKMAVEIGGGDPHRYSLGDCVLIKHNHIALLGLEEAVEMGKRSSFTKKVEVEVRCVEDAVKSAEMGVDIIMLDNMSPEEIRKVVEELEARGLRDGVILEASGGINLDNIEEFAKTGVDVISSGYITHSSRWLDFSIRVRRIH